MRQYEYLWVSDKCIENAGKSGSETIQEVSGYS